MESFMIRVAEIQARIKADQDELVEAVNDIASASKLHAVQHFFQTLLGIKN